MADDPPASVVAIVPTLGRPWALRPLAEAFAQTTGGHRILLVVDEDDRETWDALPLDGHPEVVALEHSGSYPQKLNAGIRATQEPLLLIGADDIRPHPGWLENAKAKLSDQVGFVSLNDLGNLDVMAGRYATFALIARWYAELEPYDESFHHNGCDVDASLRAKARGAFAYAEDAVMEHLHPNYGKAALDETYRRGGFDEAKNRADQELLAKRWG